MENMSDVYSNQPENTQWDNPIHNENVDAHRLTLMEEGLNRSLNVNRTDLACKLITTVCARLFLFSCISFLILILTLLIFVALKKADLG
jgi:hypothetical protein